MRRPGRAGWRRSAMCSSHLRTLALVGAVLTLMAPSLLIPAQTSGYARVSTPRASADKLSVGGHSASHQPTTRSVGPGFVQWTLCLLNNTLLAGNAKCYPNKTLFENPVLDPYTGELYVADNNSTVLVVNTSSNKVVRALPFPPRSLVIGDQGAFDPVNSEIFIPFTNLSYTRNEASLEVYSGTTHAALRTLPLGEGDGVSALYDPADGNVFVTTNQDPSGYNLYVVNATTFGIVATLSLLNSSLCDLAYSPSDHNVYVVSCGPWENIFEIDSQTLKVISYTPNADCPEWNGIALDTASGSLYTSCYNPPPTAEVYIFNSTTLNGTGAIPTGAGSQGLVYDESNEDIYVANELSRNVSVISGLSNTVVSTIDVGMDPKAFAYDAADGAIYVTEEGALAIITPDFSLVSFNESGLPVGTPWSVTLGGVSLASSSNTMSHLLPNGTYNFTVGNVTGYTATPSSGTVTINGANVTKAITFRRVSSTSTYAVTFLESGLYSGANWSVTLTGKVLSSTGSSIGFTEPNGTYSYSVTGPAGYAASPQSGSLTVTGKAVNQSVTFTKSSSKATYAVSFTESGLPLGNSWSVMLNGSTLSSTTSTLAFQQVNGSYAFSVGPATGFVAHPSSGTTSVNGATTTTSITFAPTGVVTYPVNFTEQGLPQGTSWTVKLNGVSQTGPATNLYSTITFYEPNGSYTFTLPPVPGYLANISTGTVLVADHSWPVYVGFTSQSLYQEVTFTETGLPPGTGWTVKVGSWLNSSVTVAVTFELQNGTFAYDVVTVKGYVASPPSGTVVVSGKPVNVSVTFSQTSTPPPTNNTSTFLGLPGIEGYILVVAIVAVVALAAAVLLLRKRKQTQQGASPGPETMQQSPSEELLDPP